MALSTRWILLSLLAVWWCQVDAFTFGTDDTDGDEGVEPDGDEGVEPDGDEGVEPDGDEGVEPDEDEGVEPDGYFPGLHSFIPDAAPRTKLPESDSVMQPQRAFPAAWMPRAKKPICPPKLPFCKTTTTKKPVCPPDQPHCKPHYYNPYWVPHHHFVHILNREEPDWPQLPGQDDQPVQYAFNNQRPEGPPHPRPQWFERPQGDKWHRRR